MPVFLPEASSQNANYLLYLNSEQEMKLLIALLLTFLITLSLTFMSNEKLNLVVQILRYVLLIALSVKGK